MALTLKQITDVCLQGQSARECRYLDSNSMGSWLCVKKIQAKKDKIDGQVKKFVAQAKANGQDPANMGRALGNNCAGYLPLTTIPQGYDVKTP